MTDLLLIVGAVLLSSGFFSGAEAALVSVTAAEVDVLRNRKLFASGVLAFLKKHMDRTIFTIVIMNNVVNIVGSILVGQTVVEQFGSAKLGVATTGLTFGVIIFAEIIPKSLGLHYAPRAARFFAIPVFVLSFILFPCTWFIECSTAFLKKGKRRVGTEEQIRSLVSMGRHAGYIESDEGQLIHRAFIMNDKTAANIMTPLKDVIGVQTAETIRSAAEKVFKHPYSRYPVFGTSIHDITGIVMSFDILEALSEGKDNVQVTSIARESLLVSSKIRCDKLLALFRDRHIHLAIVQEDDHTVGLVTLEDVLEELVGEIEDETDIE